MTKPDLDADPFADVESYNARIGKTFFSMLAYMAASLLLKFDPVTVMLGLAMLLGLKVDLFMYREDMANASHRKIQQFQLKQFTELVEARSKPDSMRPRSGFKAAREKGEL